MYDKPRNITYFIKWLRKTLPSKHLINKTRGPHKLLLCDILFKLDVSERNERPRREY